MSFKIESFSTERVYIKDEQFTQTVSDIKKELKSEKIIERNDAFKLLEGQFEKVKSLKPNSIEEKKQIDELLISIMGRYSTRVYTDFSKTITYAQAALQLQLQALGVLKEADFSPYTKLSDLMSLKPSFSSLMDFIQTTDSKAYPKLLEKLSDEQKILFAETAFYMANSFSNLGPKALCDYDETKLSKEELKKIQDDFVKFKVQFYGGIKEIYDSVTDKNLRDEIQKQLGEMQYNIFPGLYLDLNETIEGTITEEQFDEFKKILNEAKKFNPSLAMEARIDNLTACNLLHYFPEKIKEAKELVESSLKKWKVILEETHHTPAEKELYINLYGNTQSNYLGVLNKQGSNDFETMQKCIKDMESFYSKYKDDHPYCMFNRLNLAEYERKKGEIENALIYLQDVMDLSKKWEKWPSTKKCVERAEKMQKEITEKKL